jgi:antitoxin (DNA-binding transcriptional repressor) of toxin-antitoxin stability system
MKYITTTDLRTKSSELVAQLKSGQEVILLHRSEVLGTIVPPLVKKPISVEDGLKTIQFLAGQHSAGLRSEADYYQHLQEKYGKGLS